MTTCACIACGTPNEADARFCEGCGSMLERTCGACGVGASATARFCRSCGAPLDGNAGTANDGPTRKTVTVMFADLAGSTAFEEAVDAETAREVIGRYHDLLRSTAQRHRAGVTKYIGDGFMAVWGVPEVGADDAGRAVDAAVELQERFVGLAGEVAGVHGVNLALRVAVNTGEVVVGADDADLVGDALNVGARLESECPHGRVVVGEETWRSTRGRHRYDPLGAVHVKGRTAPVTVYQWLGHRAETADSVPFVGRSDELGRLRRVFDDSVATRTARLVTVTGDPGVGKTRLAAEFVGAAANAQVIRVRCAVEGSPALVPLVEMLRTRDLEADIPAGVPERDRILRDLTGMTAGVAGSVEETFWALRRFVEVLASDASVVMVVDDIHWADTLLIDFIEHLAEWVRGAPVLMVALARSELREIRPDLVTVGGCVSEALRLRGLEASATAELAARVLGSDQLPQELLGRLPLSTGGNPLFVRELVGMLVHDGVLVTTPEGWQLTVDVDAIAVPPTIQALLASRLERLNAADRRVLEIAAVVGTDFSPSAVAALAGLGGTEITSALNRLRRLDLAQPSGTYAGDEPVWRFHHVLIRDVGYRRLLKSDRADLHERLADWVEADGEDVSFESDEVIARHLEAAHGYRIDLGLRDERTGGLALRSARNYLASARRALDRDELVSAGTQAARGAALAADDSALQAELLLVGCEAFLSAGDVAAGAPLVDDLERIAGESLAPWAICYRCQLIAYTDPTRLPEVDERLQGAIDEFSRRKDSGGLAKAHRVRANARARLGRVGDCEIDLFEALIAARQGGDHRQITASLGAAPNAALWGPSPTPKAGGRCLDVVRMQRMTTAAPSLEATSLRCLAVLELLRGRPDKARTMLADARQVVADLGLRHGLMETELFAGIIELMVGDPVAAEPHFRTALDGLDALGVGADAGQAAAHLARSVLAQGRIDEADRYAAQSERIAGHNLKTAIAWRAVRAEILSAQGQHDAAIAFAREAVAVAADTDLVLDHADACLALSRVLAAAGDDRGASEARRDAESLYAAKDAVFMVGRTAQVTPSEVAPQTTRVSATSRLVVANRASKVAGAGWQGLQAHDPRAVAAIYSDEVFYDDQRSIRGDSIEGALDFQHAAERLVADYPHVEWHTRAVRGETLVLIWARLWDDAGNEATSFNLLELAADGLVGYHGRFDGDDFEGAYRELEERYYAGEGALFAENGHRIAAFLVAMDRLDLETASGLSLTDFLWLASPSALTTTRRTLDELFQWLQERATQVASSHNWAAAMLWLSPNCYVALGNTVAAGQDGECFEWSRLYVGAFLGGSLVSVHQFEVEDEDAAFAYAESLVAQRASRLAVSNAASRVAEQVFDAMRAKDAGAANAFRAHNLVYDDRRRFAGALVTDIEHLSAANAVVLDQYSHYENGTLAVRGERLWLGWSRWSDDDGNEVTHLHVTELGEAGLFAYECLFDEDDFWPAYREMEARYYAGEGAAYARHGHTQSAFVEAMNQLDTEASRQLCRPEFRWLSPPTTLVAPVRTVDDLFAWWRERAEQVESVQNWNSAIKWLSPEVMVAAGEARGVTNDGAEYAWSGLYVGTFRDGLVESVCGFELEDEDAAFAYAESLVAQRQRRLTVENRATELAARLMRSMEAHDVEGSALLAAEDFVLDDRRQLAWERQDVRKALALLFQQYNHFETHMLAVRGEKLCMGRTRWFDDAGNEGVFLSLFELTADGRLGQWCCFDEEEFWSAYRELETRYYSGEGTQFAECGMASAEWVRAISNADIEGVRRVSHPEFRWISMPSALKDAERTVDDMFRWMQERGRQVASQRHWVPVLHWLSPTCAVGLIEIAAVGEGGEEYGWNSIYVAECRGGLPATVREFETEEQAFAYAESVVTPKPSRLSLRNASSEAADRLIAALQAGDLDTVANTYADDYGHADHRRFGGGPITNRSSARAAWERIAQLYNRFEIRIVAVRGERLHLLRYEWSDDAGNQSIGWTLSETDVDGRIVFQDRFDEDDFEAAYAELDHRYYAGEGAPFAEEGITLTEMVFAENRGDLDGTFNVFLHPGLQIESRSRSIFPTRSAAELRRGLEELGAMVTSYRVWSPAYCWLSPSWVVARHEREAVGHDGEVYKWSRLYVAEVRGGQYASLCEFDIDDEDAAFAYAEERMRATPSRLAVTNRASAVSEPFIAALHNGSIDAAASFYSDQVVYDDRRHLGGDPIIGASAVHAAIERFARHYNRFELSTIAVRGELLQLAHHRWSDDAGNQSTGFIVSEIAPDGKVIYDGRFDEDDFDIAYQEMENRYYAGEGAAFAQSGNTSTQVVLASNAGDLYRVFGELMAPDMRVDSRSGSIFPDRTTEEFRDSVELLQAMVSSTRIWLSAIQWLSPNCAVARQEREAVGDEGEKYTWTRIYVCEFEDGLGTALCDFDIEFEEQAFAYAEERMRAAQSRLTVSNRASDCAQRLVSTLRASDLEGFLSWSSHECSIDDRRRLAATSTNHTSEPNLIRGQEMLRAAGEGLLRQFNTFEMRALAVRGERLALCVGRWSDESGNESIHHFVFELDHHGCLACLLYFDEDDFDGAYGELEKLYYEGEGAEFAEPGMVIAEYIGTKNRGDLDTLFKDLSTPDVHIDSRSRSVFLDRSAAEYRSSLEELNKLVGSVREWLAAIRWLSPRWFIARIERKAVGDGGEKYEWARVVVGEVRGGRFASACQFDADDEDTAFAYAEERVRDTASLLPVINRASELSGSLMRAMQAGEVDVALNHFSDDYVFDDHRRLSGDPVPGKGELRAAVERVLQQFSHFERRILAVRGDRLSLAWSHWSDAAGNETSYLHVYELGDNDLIVRDVRFDEDDFEGASRELETRYYVGESAQFAEYGRFGTEYLLAMNRGDFDTMFDEWICQDLRFENRSRSVFPDRSAEELRANFEDLYATVKSVRSWFSAIHWLSPTVHVGRLERQALGHDGEQYAWSYILVNQYREGRLAWIRQFDVDDEAAAMAYAKELATQT